MYALYHMEEINVGGHRETREPVPQPISVKEASEGMQNILVWAGGGVSKEVRQED